MTKNNNIFKLPKGVKPNSGILNNYFEITDKDELRIVENKLVRKRLDQLEVQKITGKFNNKHLKDIHKHLFQDIYPWAGTFRTGGYSHKRRVLENGEDYIVEYSYSDYIDHNLKQELLKIKQDNFLKKTKSKDEFITKIAETYKELDFIHAFAEGNSRTLREFTRQIALNAGYVLKWQKTFDFKDKLYKARDLGVNNNDAKGLIDIFKNITEENKTKAIKLSKNKGFDR